MYQDFYIESTSLPREVIAQVSKPVYNGRPGNVLIFVYSVSHYLFPDEIDEYIKALNAAKELAIKWQEEYDTQLKNNNEA